VFAKQEVQLIFNIASTEKDNLLSDVFMVRDKMLDLMEAKLKTVVSFGFKMSNTCS